MWLPKGFELCHGPLCFSQPTPPFPAYPTEDACHSIAEYPQENHTAQRDGLSWLQAELESLRNKATGKLCPFLFVSLLACLHTRQQAQYLGEG